MIFIAIAILFAALVPLMIIGAMALAVVWNLVALVAECRSARPVPAARTPPSAHRQLASASRRAAAKAA